MIFGGVKMLLGFNLIYLAFYHYLTDLLKKNIYLFTMPEKFILFRVTFRFRHFSEK